MRIATLLVLAMAVLTAGTHAQQVVAPASAKPLLKSIADDVHADALRATITRLVGFGTRHTMSDMASDTRGIGAARRWVNSRFTEINRDCKGCLQIEMPEQSVTGERIPQPTAIVDVLAIQRGTGAPTASS